MSDLAFDPATHTYRVGEEVLVSVTQALKLAGILDYSKIPQDVLQRAAARGTYVHKMIQLWMDGDLEVSRVDQSMLGYLDAARRFLDDSRFEPHRVECRGWHQLHRYAGTYDIDGHIGGYNDLATVDWKTGLILEGHAFQLAGYNLLRPNPRAARRIAVKLNADGSYRTHEFPSSQHRQCTFQRDQGIFLSALACAKWNLSQNGATIEPL